MTFDILEQQDRILLMSVARRQNRGLGILFFSSLLFLFSINLPVICAIFRTCGELYLRNFNRHHKRYVVFQSVIHKLLLRKLELLGIRGNALKWFESYFMNKTQKVFIENKGIRYLSELTLLQSIGIAQGG